MAAPHCSHPNRGDSDVLLAEIYPDLASLCGPVINEVTFAKTVCRLLELALSSPPPEDGFEPAAQRQDQPSCASETVGMELVLGLAGSTTGSFEECLHVTCGEDMIPATF